LNYLNRHDSAADNLILLKLCTVTQTLVPERVKASTSKPEAEFRCQGAFFRLSFWGAIVVANQDIFTKVGVCEDNGVPQHVEWSKYAFLENQRWRTAAKSNKLHG